MWGAYLWTALHTQARYHFAAAVGPRDTPSGIAARAAHTAGTHSIEALTEAIGDGWVTERMIFHGDDLMAHDPLDVVLRLEHLTSEADRLTHLTAADRWRSTPGVYTTTTYDKHGPCATLGCPNPVHLRGMCRTCYERDRKLWATDKGYVCNVPNCGKAHKGRGLCETHYWQHTTGRLAPELERYVETTPRPKGTPKQDTPCLDPECDRRAEKKGWCEKHYRRAHRAAKK